MQGLGYGDEYVRQVFPLITEFAVTKAITAFHLSAAPILRTSGQCSGAETTEANAPSSAYPASV
jgi:hypothetical protein